MDELIESIKTMVKLAQVQAMNISDDTQAYKAKCVYPEWKTETAYELGQYRNRNGILYKCLLAHTSQDDWTPESAPSLWAKVLPGQSGTDIGEWVQPDSTNPYMKGDRVTHNGKTWESDMDNNVWEPGVYGWSEVAA